MNTGAMAVISDELSNSILTPWSDTQQGFAFLSKSKLNTWSQAEADSKITGTERIGWTCYKSLIKLYGQNEAAEWTLRPTPNGFPKRMTIAFSGERNPMDEDIVDSLSVGILQNLHDWLLARAHAVPCRICPDGFAAPRLQSSFKFCFFFRSFVVLRAALHLPTRQRCCRQFAPRRTTSWISFRLRTSTGVPNWRS